ncbi:hypothetical protein SORBI_3004G258450 [Sorghum bicolor]|uniref:Uncharacterized protein n=1 Tax=Sorghum bicolor TaxID=4558 RepID=A0A1Z5RP84_SORBI|nr:hypothetical protein SORBI_3004G258450 [Sorghum bicolor]
MTSSSPKRELKAVAPSSSRHPGTLFPTHDGDLYLPLGDPFFPVRGFGILLEPAAGGGQGRDGDMSTWLWALAVPKARSPWRRRRTQSPPSLRGRALRVSFAGATRQHPVRRGGGPPPDARVSRG